MDNIFWSIDLDFWGHQDILPADLFRSILHRNVPIFIVKDHHSLLEYINDGEYQVILNTDHHSDIAEEWIDEKTGRMTTPLNCGTWACFIKGRQDKTFIWHYPHNACLKSGYGGGYCHSFDNPFRKRHVTSWGNIFKRHACEPMDGDGEVTAIGISISPDWTCRKTAKAFEPWYWKMIALGSPLVTAEEELSDCLERMQGEIQMA